MKAHLCRFFALYCDPRVLLVAILLILFSSLPSFADGFTAKQLGDYGNVTVMEVSGNYNGRNPDGSVNALPRQAIAKEFFRLHKDEYDFVVVFTNFDFKMPEAEALGFYEGVKNDIKGIGKDIFDNTSLYGSAGRLQGTIDMGNLAGKVSNPLDPGFETTLLVLAHEMQHRWGSYVHFKDAAGNASAALLGKDGSHWSYLLDTKGSVQYGNQWQDNGNGTFTSLAIEKYYSQLDLYLMGMIDKSKVPPMLLIDNPAIDPAKLPEPGVTISGTARYVTIDDIIAAEGERVPNTGDSQKQFKTAFIYAVTPGTLKSDDLYGIENIRNGFLPRYSILTDGKGLVQVTPTLKDDVPNNPGVLPPSTIPRVLPPNIDDGVKWLESRQQGDGSWTDFSLTTQRDTAETVITLQYFPVAAQSSQAGLTWLGNNASANTDYLARRIETTVRVGGDSSALVQELLGRLNSDGGWGSGRSFISNATDTALALKALAAAGFSDSQVINRAIIYLKAAQNADGGWSAEDTASTIQPTTAVISAFNAYRKSFPLDANLAGAVAFLTTKQNQDGGFGNSPSTIYDSALAVIALQAAGADKTSTGRGVSYLLGQQSESGSWLDSPYQTALAVRAVWQATVDPDLSIKPEDISIIPATITSIPTTAVLSATVWNLGRSDITQARVALYDGPVILENKVAEQVAAFPGQSPVTLTFAIPVTDAKGHFFHVVADPDNQVSESNKNNNNAIKALYPEITYDFQVLASDITVSPNPADIGKDVKITVKVTNRGTSDGFSVPVRLFIDQPAAPFEIATLSVDIPAGGSAVKELTWKAALAGTNMPLTVQIDSNNSFTETSKDNNKASVPLTVNASTLPNLSVSYKDMIITPNPAREGGNASVSVLVKNDGFSTAENVKINFYMGVAGKDGVLLGSQVIPAIAVGQGVRTAIDWNVIAVSGGKLITVQVDPDNAIQELSKDDNFTFLDLEILSLPDLAISSTSVAVNPATPKSGDTVTISVNVQNGGEQEAHDVAVQVKEGGAVIGNTVIPLVNGNSQASGTITYANSGQSGTRQVTVMVDPDGLIVERSRDNNSVVKTFSIQDANLWLTEPYISPNGDGIKDTTDFSFRLAAPAKVTVQIINKKGVAVRTFSGGELDNTAGATVTWDGKNDAGSVVDDGTYQINVLGANNAMLASLPVEVDTNRSPLTDAFGTPYQLNSNLTCMLPNYNQMDWLPDESGIVFNIQNGGYNNTSFTEGVYSMSSNGDDILRLTPFDWNYNLNPEYHYQNFDRSLSPDGKKIAISFTKCKIKPYSCADEWWLIGVDGTNAAFVGTEQPTYRINRVKWSPDSKYFASSNIKGLFVANADTKDITPISASATADSLEWAKDSRSVAWITNNNYAYQVWVSDLIGNAMPVYGPTNNYLTQIKWMTNGVIAATLSDNNIPNIWLINTSDVANPKKISNSTQYSWDVPDAPVNPDGTLIAFKEGDIEWQSGSQSTKVADATGVVSTITEVSYEGIMTDQGEVYYKNNGVASNLQWSGDGAKMGFFNNKYEAASDIFKQELMVYDSAQKTSRNVKVSSQFCDTRAQAAKYGIYSTSCRPPKQVNKIVAWMIDKINMLVETMEGVFVVNSNSGIMTPLPIDGVSPALSPNDRFITYSKPSDPAGTCINKSWNWNNGGDVWAMSSLLNMTVDLRISKKKSAIILKGIAADKNFDGYKLEYANLHDPTNWNLIIPPSNVPVFNDVFATWIPPSEGTFLVQLTVWDKAGNSAIDRKRVTWGLSSSITNLYKSLEIFSPNGDGIKDTVELNYQVLEPLHLEFTISDATGRVVRTFTKDYTEPMNDFISWDGHSEADIELPDGKYSIKVFDYEFFVTIDNTPPDASLVFSGIIPVTDGYEIRLLGHATDISFKSRKIEYGEGDNPQSWFLIPGIIAEDETPLNPIDHVIYSFVRKPKNIFEKSFKWLVGKRLRLTTDDNAGNVKTIVTDKIEEKIILNSIDDLWLPAFGNTVPLLFKANTKHKLEGFETFEIPFKSMYLQYRQSFQNDKGKWSDLPTPIVMNDLDHGEYKIDSFNDSELPPDADSLRIKAIDSLNQEHYSEEYPFIGKFYTHQGECEITGTNTVPLNSLRFQIRSDDDNRYSSWTDFWVETPSTGISIGTFDLSPVGAVIITGKHYSIRMTATTIYGYDITSKSVNYPVACHSIKPVLKYKQAECDSVSGKVNISADYSHLDIIDSKILRGKGPVSSLSFFIQETENGAFKSIGEFDLTKVSIYSPENSVDLDTTQLKEGKYKVKVELHYFDAVMNKEAVLEGDDTLIVDRVLPEAKITYPDPVGGSLVLCPIQVNTPEGPWFSIQPEGVAKDNTGVRGYELFYGEGDSPATWFPAETRGRDNFRNPISIPITGSGALQGTIGKWEITDKPGDRNYVFKLKVMDVAGNVSCASSAPVSFDKAVDIPVLTLDKALFSPNGDGSLDNVNASYEIDKYAQVDVKVFKLIESPKAPPVLDATPVRTIISGQTHISGTEHSAWNGKDDAGSNLPDGRYGIAVFATDACGNSNRKWVPVEVDNTPPAVEINYPRPIDPLPPGVMIEIKATATDPHFNSYLLEAGEGDNPTTWTKLKGSNTPVSNAVILPWNTFGLKDHWTLRLSADDTVGNKRSVTSTIDLGVRKELVKGLDATPRLFSPNNDQKLDTTDITFEVTDACNVKVDLLDNNGQSVKSFTTVTSVAGKGTFVWDGKNNARSTVPDGTYTVSLVATLSANPQVTQTETLSLIVDTTLPAMTFADPADNSYMNRTELSINGTINDLNLAGYNIAIAGPSGSTVLDSGNQNRSDYTFGRITNLAEDSYTLTVDGSDLGENKAKLTRTFIIDRTPPKATLDTPKAGEYFGGDKNIINITGAIVEKNLARYSLRYGAGETPAIWQEMVGGVSIPTTSNLFSLKAGKSDAVADGIYTISLYAKDKADLEGEARVKVIIDNTLPDVSLTSPKDGDYVTKPTDIKGTLSDTNLESGTLELAQGSCAAAVNWAVTKTISASLINGTLDTWKVLPADGEYCLRIKAADKSGNKAEAKVGFKIDTHPPAAPQLTGKISNKVDGLLSWTKNSEPDLAGYNLYRDNQRINAVLLSDISYLDAALKEGIYNYTVKAVDFAGNESVASNTVTLKIDITGPTVRISSPVNGALISNLVDIKGTAYSQDDFKEYRVHIGQGSTPSAWTEIRRSPLPITFGVLAQLDTITLQEGALYSIKLEGEDLSGNISTAQITVTIDNTPPRPPVLLTATAPPKVADVTLTWKANSETDLAGYLLYRNDQLANMTGIVAGNLKPYLLSGTTYLDKALPDGTYYYYLVAVDQAGNTSDQSNSLDITIDTHPPHMTITDPATGLKFDGKVAVKAETPDNDIATVQFQYKRPQDSAWLNLGGPFGKGPYIASFGPKSLNLTYGDYQIEALATDRAGNVDPVPTPITITYADLTPPAVPVGLSVKVRGSDATLNWTADSEPDLGYNLYRLLNGARSKVNNSPLKTNSYPDTGLADGTYQYEITALDTSGNESNPSERVTAVIYAPVISQPFTPVKDPALTVNGTKAALNASVEIIIAPPAGDAAKATVNADATGSFRLEGITLSPGENRFSAVATDSAGNISRSSDPVVVAYGAPPAVPTGLNASVQDYDMQLTWDKNREPDVIGYNLFRDGNKLNAPVAVTDGVASASYEDYYSKAQYAIDGNIGNFWSTPYGYGTFTPAWWEISIPEPALINHLNIQWGLGNWDSTSNRYNIYAGKDYEIQAWSGYNWITLKKVIANDQQINTIDITPSYRTDRIRIAIASTADPNYSKYVRIAEITFQKDNLVQAPAYSDLDLEDGRYVYTVTAINGYGFGSIPSSPAQAVVGDVVPPAAPLNLNAMAQGSNVLLDWSLPLNPEPDLAGYTIYRQNGQDWVSLGDVPASATSYTDMALPNGAYTYHITAYDQVGNESVPSNNASATIAVALPPAPPALTITAPPEGKTLVASWQQAGGSAAAYNLYRSITQGGPYQRITPSPIQSLTYQDAGLINGTRYYYVVTALDALENEGSYSNEGNGVPLDLVADRPRIFSPTLPGMPFVTRENSVTVSGYAEPSAQVDILGNGSLLGNVTASSLDIRTDTSLPLDVYGATLAPDGQTLAYVDYSGYLKIRNMINGEIVSAPLNGIQSFSSYTLQWSPGSRYLLVSGNDNSWKRRIVLYDRDLSHTSLLTTSETLSEWDASWSPSGDAIIFAGLDANGQNGIWKTSLGNFGATLLKNNINNPSYPRVSINGDHIAFFDQVNLYLLSTADGSISLVDDNTDGATLAWSPDGSKLAYLSYRDGGNGELYLLTPDDGTSSRLTYSGTDGYFTTWSPDGNQLAYATWGDTGESVRIVQQDGNDREMPASQDGMYGMEWRKSGELLFIDDLGIHRIIPAGTFTLTNARLVPGENLIVALATDTSGNRSEPSDSISVVLDTGERPDLVITNSDVTVFPPYPKPGDDVVVTARVHNPTNNPVSNVIVNLYQWDGSGDVALLKTETIPHLDANGEGSVAVGFNAGMAIGARTIIAVADPDNLIAEVLETNNYAAKDLVVTDQQRVSVVTSLNSSQFGANQDAIIGVTLRNSGTATSGSLNVIIEDASGNLVKLLSSQPQDLPYGLDRKLSFTWNSGTTYSGPYKVHAVVKDGSGMTTLAEHTTQFSIMADLQARGSVTTDKQAYGSSEPVIVSVSFSNSGANYIIPQLKARVRIVDSQNGGLFSDEKTFANLLPSMGGSFTSAWNTGMSAAGGYTAFLDIFAGDQLLVSKSATFSIMAQPLLKGTLTVNPATVPVGRSFIATYNISNKGNSAFIGTVNVSLLDPDTQAIAGSFEQPVTILPNGSLSGEFTFSSQGLQLKPYQLNLWDASQGTRKNLASAGITISDVTPPVVTIVSPAAGALYNAAITIAALASDDASGVDRVEYQLDSGAWKLLPIADPASGKYAVMWDPALNENGPHTISFRALDKAKNQSNPVSVTCSFDNIPPTGSIIINNGVMLTNSILAQLLLSATDAGGVSKMRFSSDGVTWTDPEAYSATRQWQLTSGDGPKQVYVKFMDNATNWSQAVQAGITLDATPPSVSATPAGAIYKSAQNVALTSSEPVIINYTTDGTDPGADSAVYSQAIPITVNTVLKFIARDPAGNKSPEITETYTIDTVPPVLTVSTLSNGSYTNNATVNIAGTATDNTGIQGVTINGTTVQVNADGSFSYAMLLQSGANTITVTAIDLGGNLSTDTRTINLDLMAPVLVVTAPADNSKTGTALTDVKGTVDDVNATVTVRLGNSTQTAILTGNDFIATVLLAPKENTIEITATDLATNTSSQKRTVFYDDQKPSLAITDPNQDIRTNKSTLTIRGTASDPYGLAVTVSIDMDGQTYNPALVNGQFEQAVTFTTQKSYAIVVTATNEVKASTSAQRNVIYDITPPSLTITPVTSPTSQPNQVVTGTMESGAMMTVTCPTATVGTVTYPSATTWSVNITNMTLGDNAITATATDLSNNSATASADIVYKITQTVNTFDFAIFGNTGVTMSGGSYTDSYISTPPHITRGQYKHGDVGTNALQCCSLRLSGGAQIFGNARVGFGGNPAKAVCLSGGASISGQSGALSAPKDMTPKKDPGGGKCMGALTLSSHATKTLTAGEYRFSSISLSGGSKLTISGQVTIHLDGNLTVSGGSSIVTASGPVTIYANGQTINLSGGSVTNNTQDPKNLVIYGTAKLQCVNLSGGTSQHFLVYAPTANISLSGGQNTFGSVIGKSVNISGGSSVHYDEVLSH